MGTSVTLKTNSFSDISQESLGILLLDKINDTFVVASPLILKKRYDFFNCKYLNKEQIELARVEANHVAYEFGKELLSDKLFLGNLDDVSIPDLVEDSIINQNYSTMYSEDELNKSFIVSQITDETISSRETSEILQNLSAIFASNSKTPQKIKEGQKLLASLSELLTDEEAKKTSNNQISKKSSFEDSGHSSSLMQSNSNSFMHSSCADSFQSDTSLLISQSDVTPRCRSLSFSKNVTPKKLLKEFKMKFQTRPNSFDLRKIQKNKDTSTEKKKGPIKAFINIVKDTKNVDTLKKPISKLSEALKNPRTIYKKSKTKPLAQSTPHAIKIRQMEIISNTNSKSVTSDSDASNASLRKRNSELQLKRTRIPNLKRGKSASSLN